MNLYQIDMAIANCVDFETGEIIDSEMLESLQIAREKKVEGVALWIKNLRAEADALSNEIKSLQHRKKVAENKVETLKKFLLYALDGEEFNTPKVAVSYRMSSRVEVFDINLIDKKYIRIKEPEADKAAIKKALNNGEQIEGAILVPVSNIQIK